MRSKSPRKTAEEAGSGRRMSDLAYARILEILFERRLPAGAFVSQAELVELTGVSVGPLRDSLRVLEAEGLLKVHPRTGIQFVKPGLELTRSTYQFREIIEAAAMAVFSESAPKETVAALLRRHQAAADGVEQHGLSDALIAEVEDLELVFHGGIVASLNNPLIDSSYRRVHNYIRLLRLDRRVTPTLMLHSLREHMAILEACRRHDAPAAVAALRAHFSNALQRNFGLYRY